MHLFSSLIWGSLLPAPLEVVHFSPPKIDQMLVLFIACVMSLLWANWIRLFVAGMTIAKVGQPTAAMASCFAEPMFDMLVGLGTTLIIQKPMFIHMLMGMVTALPSCY